MRRKRLRLWRRIPPADTKASPGASRRARLAPGSAGARPNNIPTRSEETSVNSNTGPLSCTSASRGMAVVAVARSARMPHTAMAKPTPPPISESKALSVSNWRISRTRPAPRAVRRAISRCRATPRASIKFATFAQAMSKTKVTAPKMIKIGSRASPATSCCNGTSRNRQSASFEYARSITGCIAPNSASVCHSFRPGFSRAMAATLRFPLAESMGELQGCQISVCTGGSVRGKWNPGGITPTTVRAFPSSVSVCPTAVRLPKRRRRMASPITRTWSRPAVCSSGRKVRPSAGGMPKVEKKPSETVTVRVCSGSPTPVRTAAPS